MTEDELLAAMQKVVRAGIALAQAKMKRYIDAILFAEVGSQRFKLGQSNPFSITASERDRRWDAAEAAGKDLICQ